MNTESLHSNERVMELEKQNVPLEDVKSLVKATIELARTADFLGFHNAQNASECLTCRAVKSAENAIQELLTKRPELKP
jgi:hypothetical protein